MPIKLSVWTRDLRAMIRDIPCKMRVSSNGPVIDCDIEATGGILQLLEGGTVDEWIGNVTAVAADLESGRPMPNDIIQLQLNNGTWREFEVIGTPDAANPNTVAWTMNVGSPNSR